MGQCDGIGFWGRYWGHLPDAFGDVALRFGFSAYDILMPQLWWYSYLRYNIPIKEESRPLTPKALWGGVKNVLSIIKGASILAVTQPTLLLLLIAVALTLMATNPVEVFWPTQVKNMLNAGHANTTIGILTAVFYCNCTWLSSVPSCKPNVRASKRRYTERGPCLPFGASNYFGVSEQYYRYCFGIYSFFSCVGRYGNASQ